MAEIARRKECLLIVDAAAPASTGIQFMDLLRKGSALEKRIPLHIRNTPLFVQGKLQQRLTRASRAVLRVTVPYNFSACLKIAALFALHQES